MTTKTRKILLIAGIIVAVIIGISVFFVVRHVTSYNKAEKLVDEYMTAIENMDAKTLAALSDIEVDNTATSSDAEDSADSTENTELSVYESIVSTFEMLESYDIEWSIDYEITDISRGNSTYKDNISETIYDGEAKVKKCYICNIDYTVTVTEDETTNTTDNTITLVCYKKDGDWFIAGLE